MAFPRIAYGWSVPAVRCRQGVRATTVVRRPAGVADSAGGVFNGCDRNEKTGLHRARPAGNCTTRKHASLPKTLSAAGQGRVFDEAAVDQHEFTGLHRARPA